MLSSEQLSGYQELRQMRAAHSMQAFQKLLHDVNERSVLIRDKEGFFPPVAVESGDRGRRGRGFYEPSKLKITINT